MVSGKIIDYDFETKLFEVVFIHQRNQKGKEKDEIIMLPISELTLVTMCFLSYDIHKR